MSKDWEDVEDWELDPRFNGAAEMAKQPSEFEKFKEAVKVIVNVPKPKKRKPKKKPKKTPKKKGG
jgi:hypothetical protein